MTDRVQIIRPPNTLAKAKTGSGKGVIDHEAIARAEAAIEQVGKSFQDWASADLAAMEAALEAVKSEPSQHDVQIREIYRRAMDLKGQGGTFGKAKGKKDGNFGKGTKKGGAPRSWLNTDHGRS